MAVDGGVATAPTDTIPGGGVTGAAGAAGTGAGGLAASGTGGLIPTLANKQVDNAAASGTGAFAGGTGGLSDSSTGAGNRRVVMPHGSKIAIAWTMAIASTIGVVLIKLL